jgi:hypothetical protein
MSRDRSGDRPKTAAELMAELQQDPEYVARERSPRQQQQENVQLYASAAEPVLADLEEGGFHVQSVGELRQSGAHYRKAIPTLLRWLPLVSYPPLKEDIVRALSVPWARPGASRALIEEFRRADDEASAGLSWAIANALEVVADDDVLDDLVRLVRDPGYGKAREMLALALGNMKSPRAVSVLRELLRDDELVGHAVMALGKLGAAAALPDLEGLVQHPKKWVREEARSALARTRSRLE